MDGFFPLSSDSSLFPKIWSAAVGPSLPPLFSIFPIHPPVRFRVLMRNGKRNSILFLVTYSRGEKEERINPTLPPSFFSFPRRRFCLSKKKGLGPVLLFLYFPPRSRPFPPEGLPTPLSPLFFFLFPVNYLPVRRRLRQPAPCFLVRRIFWQLEEGEKYGRQL